MRKKLLLGNWKMNKTPSEAKEFASSCEEMVKKAIDNNVDVGVAPTFVCLCPVVKYAPKGLIVSAQNCSQYDHGAYTGEVSIPMLKEVGVTYCIIGHSERREYDAETSEKCNAKIKALLAAEITPVYCCGESLATYEEGKTNEWVAEQIKAGMKDLTPEQAAKVVIAYEPIWAIGTGKSATKETAEETIGFIRKTLEGMFGAVAQDIRILYGGSVKPENIHDYMSMEDIDGALVGGASLKLDSYKALIDNLIG
ncbi:MAG: triose-phosphate isomerase [Bacilli bacterium]|nr:triose-phosphate isomerase [Bacilli bacterium]